MFEQALQQSSNGKACVPTATVPESSVSTLGAEKSAQVADCWRTRRPPDSGAGRAGSTSPSIHWSRRAPSRLLVVARPSQDLWTCELSAFGKREGLRSPHRAGACADDISWRAWPCGEGHVTRAWRHPAPRSAMAGRIGSQGAALHHRPKSKMTGSPDSAIATTRFQPWTWRAARPQSTRTRSRTYSSRALSAY